MSISEDYTDYKSKLTNTVDYNTEIVDGGRYLFLYHHDKKTGQFITGSILQKIGDTDTLFISQIKHLKI